MKKTMKLASRGKRFAAGMIDAAIPLVAYIIMTSTLGMSNMLFSDPYYGGYGFNYGYGYNYNLTGGSSALMGLLCFVLLAYIIAEFILYSKAKSIGKALIGLQVVSSVDGKPFGFWKMVLRECVVKGASSSVFMIGYIWILIDEKNRAWHDKILDSYVVDLKETERMHERVTTMAPAAEPRKPVVPTSREVPRPVAPQPTEAPRPAAPQPTEEPKPAAPQPTEAPRPVAPQPTETPGPAAPQPTEEPKPAETPVQEVRPMPQAQEVRPMPQVPEEAIKTAGDAQTDSIKDDDTEI